MVIVVEFIDLIFAVDSIPSILSTTNDAFIFYTSNICTILVLRSLYFALAGIEKYFTYIKYGLSLILVFVGVKNCLADISKIPTELSLAFITLSVSIAVLASMILQADKKNTKQENI